MRSVNPATEELLQEYSTHSDDDIKSHLRRADEAFQSWRQTSFSHRADHFRRLATFLRDGVDDYARRMTEEMGKPIKQARSEVEKCAWVCEYFADNAAAFLEPRSVETDAARSRVVYQPLGTILAIMPWNFPFWQVFRFAAPTLMAGNSAILKHASNVSGCAADITELFEKAGFPQGVFHHLFIDHDQVEQILSAPTVCGVALTGSERAGRSVGSLAGKNLKPCVLELGGSDPFIILEDCDLEKTLDRAVFARTMNNGQSCIAAKRFIVEEGIYDKVAKEMSRRFEALTLGNPIDEEVDVGPLARADLRDDLHDQVERSIEAGAHCLTGGSALDGKGFFYKPTLLGDVKPGMAAFDEETFGPVAALIRARDADHAVELANNSEFGLGASVWTADIDRGEKLAMRLEAGAVFVNEIVKSDPRLPFGGIKNSGFGRELSADGIREFVNVKTVWVD